MRGEGRKASHMTRRTVFILEAIPAVGSSLATVVERILQQISPSAS